MSSQPAAGGLPTVVLAPCDPALPQLQQAQPAVFVLGVRGGGSGGGGGGLPDGAAAPQLLPQAGAPRRASLGPLSLQALQLDADAADVLGSLAAAGAAAGDPWALAAVSAAPASAGSLPPALMLPLAQAQHTQAAAAAAAAAQLTLQQAAALGLAGGGGGLPLLAPAGPRAPRARRHSMFVTAGQAAAAARRNSVGNYDAAGQLLASEYGLAAAAAATQPGLASAAIAERLAAAAASAGAPPPLLQPVTLGLQAMPLPLAAQLPGVPPAPPPAPPQQQVWISAAGTGGPVLMPTAPRAPAAGASRRHSWAPTTVYYSSDGPRAALHARLAYRAVAPSDALAVLGLGGGDASGASSYAGLATALGTPASSWPSQPASPLSSSTGSGAAGHGLPPGVALQVVPDAAGGHSYVLVPTAGGGAAKVLTGPALAGLVDATSGSDAAAVLLDPGLLAGQAAALYADYAAAGAPALALAAAAAAHAPPRVPKPGGRPPPRGGESPPGPTGVTPPEQLRLLPVPAPASKVCGDARWELKRSGSSGSGVSSGAGGAGGAGPDAAAGSVENLKAWLESRRTLEGERLREERRAARAAARAAVGAGAPGGVAPGGSGAPDAGAPPAAFAYALPDAGDDTWGGAAAAAAAAADSASSEPSNKLFVGNIGWWVTEEDLYSWFSRFGTVTGVKVRPARRAGGRAGGMRGGLGWGALSSTHSGAAGGRHRPGPTPPRHAAIQSVLNPGPSPLPARPSPPPPQRSCTTRARCTSPRTSGAAASTASSTMPPRPRRRARSCGWTALSCRS
jgi:hypothetical protein